MLPFHRAALVLGLLSGSVASSCGQQASPPGTFTGVLQGVPFAEFARQVAAATPYRLYFDPAETDSLRVTLAATDQPLPAGLHFAIDEERRVYTMAGPAVQTPEQRRYLTPDTKCCVSTAAFE